MKSSRSDHDDDSKKAVYYYASGRRVPLEPVQDLVAVDTEALECAGLTGASRKKFLSSSRPLRRSIVLAEADSLPDAVSGRLRQAAALHSVFRHGSDLVIVLPEVRVEEHRKSKIRKLERWIDEAGDSVRVDGSPDKRLTLRPASGRGEDALDIANELHRAVRPELAQARFVRVVRRPDLRS